MRLVHMLLHRGGGLYQSALIHSFISHVPKTWLLIAFDSEMATG
jgi:hypothetical protein